MHFLTDGARLGHTDIIEVRIWPLQEQTLSVKEVNFLLCFSLITQCHPVTMLSAVELLSNPLSIQVFL